MYTFTFILNSNHAITIITARKLILPLITRATMAILVQVATETHTQHDCIKQTYVQMGG